MESPRETEEQKRSVSEVIDAPITVTIGEEEYTLHPLQMGDIAEAEAFLLQERIDAFLTNSRNVSRQALPDVVRSQTLSQIITTPVTFDDTVASVAGQMYLQFLSLRKGGMSLSFKDFKRQQPAEVMERINEILMEITGLGKFMEESEGEDPLETQDSTSTTETEVRTFSGSQELSQ